MSNRIFEGEIRLCDTSNRKMYKVRLMLLNEKVCRNNWVFTNIRLHVQDVANIPILYSVIDGKICNNHDFEVKIDKKTGAKYPSFIGATSEHIGGFINEFAEDGTTLNAHIEVIDGVEWLVADGYLWKWYNRELINEIEKNGGSMAVSIESVVDKSHIEGGVEYEDEYAIVGVTILGTGVTEAVAGANIRKLSASIGELEELKVRAASYLQEEPIEPQTQIKNSQKGVISMKKVKDLQSSFPGFTVLAVQGKSVALLSDAGEPYLSEYEERKGGEVVCGEKDPLPNCCAIFSDGQEDGKRIEVPLEIILAAATEKNASLSKQLEEVTNQRDTANALVTELRTAERARRKGEVESAIKSRLAEFNANREESMRIPEEKIETLLTAAREDKYTDLVDANGQFIGASVAEKDVAELCMREQIALDKQAATIRTAAQQRKFAWEGGTEEPPAQSGIMSAAARILQ